MTLFSFPSRKVGVGIPGGDSFNVVPALVHGFSWERKGPCPIVKTIYALYKNTVHSVLRYIKKEREKFPNSRYPEISTVNILINILPDISKYMFSILSHTLILPHTFLCKWDHIMLLLFCTLLFNSTIAFWVNKFRTISSILNDCLKFHCMFKMYNI